MEDDLDLLKGMGLNVRQPEPGCCGMAGSFDFEAGHYDVSTHAGERALLPAVRKAGRDTLVIADGFCCQTQIALHVAQVLPKALRQNGRLPDAGGQSGYNGHVRDGWSLAMRRWRASGAMSPGRCYRSAVMTHYRLTIPEVGLIAGTRALAGVGIGLLAAGVLDDRIRKTLGWSLLGVGVLTTPFLIANVLRHEEPGQAADNRLSAGAGV